MSLSKSHDGMSNKLLLQILDKHVPNNIPTWFTALVCTSNL